MTNLITAAEARQRLSYDPETGMFIWRHREGDDWLVRRHNTRWAGKQAGRRIASSGYRLIRIADRCYPAHRLAWLMVYGAWPSDLIDHSNGDRADNRLCNLRAATSSQNLHNSKLRVDNTSGVKGVNWNTKAEKWYARIGLNGRRRSLGYFENLVEAEAAIRTARSDMHGDYARHT